MKRFVLLSVCLLAVSSILHAATLTSPSLAQTDVQKTVDAAADGDTVILPAGTATWSASVTITGKFLTIQGAGTAQTTIVGGEYAPSAVHPTHRMFDITAKPGGLTRLTAFTLDGGDGARDGYNKGMIDLAGASTTWRIDHLRIRATRTCAMYIHASGGVIDHNTFDLIGWTFGIYGFNGGGSYGDAAWAEDDPMGAGDKAFFAEDNVFNATPFSIAFDGWSGQRIVIRHNTLNNALIGNHGTESSGRLRGARSFEIYLNTITLTGRDYPEAIGFRSGTGVVFSNSITGNFKGAMDASNFRDWCAFRPWGIATGESPFDKNDTDASGKPIIYDTGTHTGAQGVLVLASSGKNWTNDQWRGYSVHNAATGKSSVILSNTRDTITAFTDSTYGGPNLMWHTGDGFKIERCLIALDQFGRGKGNRITGDDPSPVAWPEEALEPVYIWGNTLNGHPAKMTSHYPHVKEGVDFFNDTPKPGYTPYTYPHPLTK